MNNEQETLKQVKDEGNSSQMEQPRLEDMEIKRGLLVDQQN